MSEKHEINAGKSFTILCVAAALMAGGFFTVRHIQQRNREAEEAARESEQTAATPSPEVKSAEDYGIEIIYDGVIGNEPSETEPEQAAVKPITSPTGEADDNTAPPEGGTTAPAATAPAATPTLATQPAATAAPVATPAPAAQTPTDGSTNSAGQVYIPGFGWYAPTGGVSTPSHGNGGGEEQIGTMG